MWLCFTFLSKSKSFFDNTCLYVNCERFRNQLWIYMYEKNQCIINVLCLSNISGLPYHLCGINSTLTEEVYSTSGESLFIQVNWSRNSFLAGQLRGTFVLKFVTYHTGINSWSMLSHKDDGLNLLHCLLFTDAKK